MDEVRVGNVKSVFVVKAAGAIPNSLDQ